MVLNLENQILHLMVVEEHISTWLLQKTHLFLQLLYLQRLDNYDFNTRQKLNNKLKGEHYVRKSRK